MHHPPQTARAARRDPDGSRKIDHLWQAIKAEVNRDAAEEQLKSAALGGPDQDADALPLVREARARDRIARFKLGLPLVDHGRRQYAAEITRHEFDVARRRGRGWRR